MNRILIVDDNEKLCTLLKRYTRDKFYVEYCLSPADVVNLISDQPFDLIILDIVFKDYNGIEFLPKLREIYSNPIIFLSAQTDISMRIAGLRGGADDFITKPFNLEELTLKIEKILGLERKYRIEEIGEYKIDHIEQRLYRNGEEIRLSAYPFRVLVFLLQNKNKLVTREQLFNNVWNCDYHYSSRLIDTNISVIRKETQDASIKTIRNQGYMYEYLQK